MILTRDKAVSRLLTNECRRTINAINDYLDKEFNIEFLEANEEGYREIVVPVPVALSQVEEELIVEVLTAAGWKRPSYESFLKCQVVKFYF